MLRFLFLLALASGATAAFAISVSEVVEQGQPSYRVETPTATWVYHREGAGFSGLLDPEGNDWLSYRPQGGAAGHYRGIPNAVYRRATDGSNFFHPGHAGSKGSETSLVSADAKRVVLRSTSRDKRWTCDWEIRPDRAVMTMSGVPGDDGTYWFLYEGTPGGRFEPTDLCVRADGKVTTLADRWESTMKQIPWVAFVSPSRGRALLLVAHTPPAVPVSYRPMENAMTVFGFGRRLANLDNLLAGKLTFTVMLLKETDPARIAEAAADVAK